MMKTNRVAGLLVQRKRHHRTANEGYFEAK